MDPDLASWTNWHPQEESRVVRTHFILLETSCLSKNLTCNFSLILLYSLECYKDYTRSLKLSAFRCVSTSISKV